MPDPLVGRRLELLNEHAACPLRPRHLAKTADDRYPAFGDVLKQMHKDGR